METPSTETESINGHTKKRVRNSPYPSYTLETCIKFVTRIDEEFSNINFTPAKDISETLGVSGGSFLQQLSSCVQYGLLELRSGEGYKPTGLFEKIKKPLPHENENDALIESFQCAPLYKTLINDLKDKKLPSEKGLANTLDRTYGLKGNAANVAAKVFLRNAQSLGVIAEGNILKIDTTYISFEETDDNGGDQGAGATANNTPPATTLALPPFNPSVNNSKPPQKETREIPVFLQGEDREARLILPTDFTEDDLKRIVKILTAYLS